MKTNLSIITLLVVLFISINIYSQSTKSNELVRSTHGVSGSSENVSANNKSYIIQQSIGQASSIGTFSSENYTVRQGFIQPNVMSKIRDVEIPLNLKAIVYPNPFVAGVTLSFTEEIKDNVEVALFDLLGRLIFSKSYKANQKVNVQFHNLSVANYILKITANNKQFIKNIIKK